MVKSMDELKEMMDLLDGRVTESTQIETVTVSQRNTSNIDRWRNNTSVTQEDV